MNFETPLTSLVCSLRLFLIAITFVVSKLMIPELGGDSTLWWKSPASSPCGTLAGAVIPELVKSLHFCAFRHTWKEVVTSSEEGGSFANILSGLVAGNFSAYWLGISIVALMSIAFYISTFGLGATCWRLRFSLLAWWLSGPGHGSGNDCCGFLRPGPRNNAQSVYELSLIEQVPNVQAEVKRSLALT